MDIRQTWTRTLSIRAACSVVRSVVASVRHAAPLRLVSSRGSPRCGQAMVHRELGHPQRKTPGASSQLTPSIHMATGVSTLTPCSRAVAGYTKPSAVTGDMEPADQP